MPSYPPVLLNTCTDTGDLEATDAEIISFCTPNAFGPEATITSFCNRYGGTYDSTNPAPNPNTPFPDPEWVFGRKGDYGGCDYDDTKSGYAWVGKGCGGGACPITGVKGFCTRTVNSGDPLICALRDYQCNGNNELSNPTCFSDDTLNSTCNKDFRAPDTIPSNFLLNQLCLGNIDGAIQNFSGGTGFYRLWTDKQSPDGSNWTILGTPSGTKYRSSEDLEFDNDCTYDNGGNPTGGCTLSTWAVGQPGAPSTYLPNPNPYVFSGSLPPCQQIFWRTLYGNQPEFKNNYYAPIDVQANCPDGSQICDNTSIPPQVAACGAIPFQGVPTPSGFINAQRLLENAVNKYYHNNGNLLDSFNATSTDFQSWVYTVCANYPGLCSNFLQNTVCNNLTAEDVINNEYALQWCGCNLSPSTYQSYAEDFDVSKECTPFCNIPNVIPSFDTDTNAPQYCNQSVCIIDDVTITLAKTRLQGTGGGGGNVNFNQICNSCSSTGNNGTNINSVTNSSSVNATNNSQTVATGNASINCRCVLNNFTLTTIGSTIEGGINISQACNGNATCYSSGSTSGSQLEVDCHGSSTSQNDVLKKAEAALLKKAQNTSNYWVILIIIIFIALIIIAWLLISPRGIPETDLIYSKRINLPAPQAPRQNIFVGSFNKPKAQFY